MGPKTRGSQFSPWAYLWLVFLTMPQTTGATLPVFVDSNSLGNNFATSLTFAIDSGVGDDRYIRVAFTAHQGAGQATGVTYDGIALTKIDALTVLIGGEMEHTVWFLAGATVATGSNNVIATVSSGTRIAATAITLSGVDPSTPHGDQDVDSTTTATKTINITTTATDSFILSECSSQNGTITSTPGSGQTEREDVSSLGNPSASRVNMAANTRPAVSIGTFSMDHTLSATPDAAVISAVEILSNGAAPVGPIDVISAGVPTDLVSAGVPIDEIAG